MAGIPIALYVLLLLIITQSPASIRTIAVVAGSVIGSVTLPIIFLINAKLSGLPITISLQNLSNVSWTNLLGLTPFLENRFHPFLDAAYLFGWNRLLILIALLLAGVIILRRRRTALAPYLLPSLVLTINYLLLSTVVHFDFLISYERGSYAARVFETAQFFLLPLLGIVLCHLLEMIKDKPLPLRAGASVLVAMMMTSSLYMTYPRHDNYDISRGFNVGISDYDTVEYIHDQNTDDSIDYVVLANQAVSSAAMDRYGFLQYYHGDIFYYPIPTGGPLYQLYLDMVNVGPTHRKAVEAMDLAGVDTAYFVVNDYWFLADKIIENAKREANAWIAIDNGATYVFEYLR